MDLMHHAHTLALGNDRLFLAPLKDDIQVSAAQPPRYQVPLQHSCRKCWTLGQAPGFGQCKSQIHPHPLQLLTLHQSDFADAYPNCEVIGTDISPIQSTWIPPNLKL
ncbi:hypothetical protein IMZ48_13770 [Candidatus Bathyarchaeota archaeon]|nr:hypothetical protein [Candidatus Bathyarchaeota archaeon]